MVYEFQKFRTFQKVLFGTQMIGSLLGEGAYGEVRKGLWKKKVCAIKTIKSSKHSYFNGINETKILQALQGDPYIIKYFGIIEDVEKFQFALELYPSSLSQFLRTNQRISMVLIKRILSQILSGLKFAHKKQIYHGDLAPRNILINTEKIAISDWGSADTFRLESEKGKQFCKKQDLVEVGKIFLELLSLSHYVIPWDNQKITQWLQKLLGERRLTRLGEGFDLLRRLINPDDYSIVNVEDALNHPWLLSP